MNGDSDVLSMTPEQIRTAMCRDICTQFVENRERTPRKALRKYRNSQSIATLSDANCIETFWDKPDEEQSYAPRLGAFFLAGNEEYLRLIKSGMTSVVGALQALYDDDLYDMRSGFDPEDVFKRAKTIDPAAEQRALELGLCFIQGADVSNSMNDARTVVTRVFVRDAIGDIHHPELWADQQLEQWKPRIEDRRRYELRPTVTGAIGEERDSGPELESLVPTDNDPSFEVLVKSFKDSMASGAPESGVDRLHTFTVKFLRVLCDKYGLATDRDKPLHSLMGAYVKAADQRGRIKSEMARRILKTSISVMESFSEVRNDLSLAHDNPVLDSPEALLI